MAEKRSEGARRGGEERSNVRRAARQWAVIGEQVRAEDLPAVLRAAMIAVRNGDLEPAQATAIAGLAKTSLSLSHDIERRIEALEEAARVSTTPANVRRLA